MTEKNQNDPVGQMQAAMKFFVEMQKPAQEAMKLFADTQMKFVADAQRPAQEAVKVFAELQKPALEGMKAFAELQNAAQQAMKAFLPRAPSLIVQLSAAISAAASLRLGII